jgi:ankyrin repeat protein
VQACLDNVADKPDVNYVHRAYGYTALHIAVQAGNLEIVELLIKEGADPNTRGTQDLCVLFVAATFGFTDIVKVLLKAGADASFKHRGLLPAESALSHGHFETAEIIIRQKVETLH